MSVVPKVTAFSGTAALWRFLEGDAAELTRVLKGMTQSELVSLRTQLRELARSVDGEIHRKYSITASPPTRTQIEDS